jgi:outer membrane protein assembly factor BamE (lipoprotein component of BamABCDE complex)
MKLLASRLSALALLSLALGLASGCASGGDSGGQTQPAAQAQVKPITGKLAEVKLGMNDMEVRNILGDPASANNYITGKGFIPFYYGTDTTRTDWIYPGLGRVVFSRNQYSRGLKVINILAE